MFYLLKHLIKRESQTQLSFDITEKKKVQLICHLSLKISLKITDSLSG